MTQYISSYCVTLIDTSIVNDYAKNRELNKKISNIREEKRKKKLLGIKNQIQIYFKDH